ncbi:hypothetical protein [Streptomyces sp. KLOTTS4A1]|uniref:hypothetical protein n=1 Tax=Streptomyces sp. KLOTTS4A1 TaxID=3390996 RepID=UPI0039F5B20C
MSNVLTMNDGPRKKDDDRGPARVGATICFTDTSGPAPSVVYVERELPSGGIPAYRKARESGARSLVLWADDLRAARVATVVTRSARHGVATFQVLGAHGEVVGTLKREKALRGRGLRTRWTVHPTGAPQAVGFKGRIVWWWMWWLLLPLMAVVSLISIFDAAAGNEVGVARAPRRIRWRANGQVPLEFRSKDDKLHLHAPGVDWRLAAALLALVRSFKVGAWDSTKK